MKRRRAALVLLGALVFGVLLGVLATRSLTPRMDGMTITGGPPGMPGMGPMSGMTVSSGSQSASADLAAAHQALEAGRFAEAAQTYERVLRDDPHSVEALVHLGLALAGRGDVDRGLGEMDKALAMAPDNLHALWAKAHTLFESKQDYAASIPWWERAASLATDPQDAATARGYALRARERAGAQPGAAPGGSR